MHLPPSEHCTSPIGAATVRPHRPVGMMSPSRGTWSVHADASPAAVEVPIPRSRSLVAARLRSPRGSAVVGQVAGDVRGSDRTRLTLPFEVSDAKLQVPAARPGIVERATLVDRLLATPAAPVIAVVAPPGYGKTTLLAQWAETQAATRGVGVGRRPRQRSRGPAGLPRDGAEPGRADRPARVRARSRPPGPVSRCPAGWCPRSPRCAEPVALVIDHFEAVTNPECFDTIAAISLGLPPGRSWPSARATRCPYRRRACAPTAASWRSVSTIWRWTPMRPPRC